MRITAFKLCIFAVSLGVLLIIPESVSGQAVADPAVRSDWSVFTGTVENDSAAGVAVDRFGNVYVTGSTRGAFPGYTNQGESDGYLLRCDKDGSSIRVFQWGDSAQDQPHAVAVNAQGHVTVVGIKVYPRSRPVGFARTYRADGTLLADLEVRVSSFTWPTSCAYDRYGNLYIAGSANSPSGNGGIGFVRKYSANGVELWTRHFGDAPGEYATAKGVAIAPNNSVIVVGYAFGRFGGQPTNGRSDGFAASLTPSGRVNWVRRSDLPGADNSWGVAVNQQHEIFLSSGIISPDLGNHAPPANAETKELPLSESVEGSAEWLLQKEQHSFAGEEWLIRVIDYQGNVKRNLRPDYPGAAKRVALAADGNLWVAGRSGLMLVDKVTGHAIYKSASLPDDVASDGDRGAYFVGFSGSHNGSPSTGGNDLYIDKYIGPAAPAVNCPCNCCSLQRCRWLHCRWRLFRSRR